MPKLLFRMKPGIWWECTTCGTKGLASEDGKVLHGCIMPRVIADHGHADKLDKRWVPAESPSSSHAQAAREAVESHGEFKDNFERIASMWSKLFNIDITPRGVAIAMILVKISREMQAHNDDNIIDMIGYALLAEKL